MYEKQFQFRSRPFCCIPSAEYYFPASSIDNALETIKLCVDRASGPAIVLGQSGWGKSQLLAVLERDYKSHFRVVNVVACTRMSRRHDLLQNILFELGQPYRDMSEGELRLALIDYLKPTAQCPHGVLLLVDDGYTLPSRLLDELRMITNFVRDGQSRVRLVIAGTQTLEEKLAHPQLEPLNQRIAARCYLQCLRRDEVEPYIRHQVVRAGCPNQDIFHSSAIAAVMQLCEGNPRTINQICDHALILAASCGQSTVSGEIIAEAFSDIQQLPASMWIPAVESKAIESKENADGSWAVVEFGQIGDSNEAAPPAAEMPSSELTTEPEEIASLESISESVDDFSKMVDSLAHLYADSIEEESLVSDLSLEISDVPAQPNQDAARDPFAEAFAEEYSIQDNYALLAARQNRSATQMTEGDVSRLEQHLQTIQADFSNVTSAKLLTEQANRQISLDPQMLSESSLTQSSNLISTQELSVDSRALNSECTSGDAQSAGTASLECPIVDHRSYQTARDDSGDEAPAHTMDAAANDDRDMLVVSQIDRSIPTPPGAGAYEWGGVSVTRGQAVRLEYARLFQQLRGGDPSQQHPNRK